MVDAQRPRPLPPGDRRDRPGRRRWRSARRTCARRWSTSGCATAPTPASSATTRPTCATGPGPGSARTSRLRRPRAGARRQRRLEHAQAAPARRRRRRPFVLELDSPGSGVDRRELERGARGRSAATPTSSATGSSTAASASAPRSASMMTSGRSSRELTDLAPLHQPKSLAALDAVSRGAVRACRRSRASTPPSTRRCRRRPRPTRCRPSWRERWRMRRYGFHGLLALPGSHAGAPAHARRARTPRSADRHAAIWAPARRCARSTTGARSTPRWASRRSRAW